VALCCARAGRSYHQPCLLAGSIDRVEFEPPCALLFCELSTSSMTESLSLGISVMVVDIVLVMVLDWGG
jgi:hypothetical protein